MRKYKKCLSLFFLCIIFAVNSLGCGTSASDSEGEQTSTMEKTDHFAESGEESSTEESRTELSIHAASTMSPVEETSASPGVDEDPLSRNRSYWIGFSYQKEVYDYNEDYLGIPDGPAFDSYLLNTDEKYYTKEDLAGFNEIIIWLAKNEIYARYGRIFQNEDLNCYFMSRTWYVPTTLPEYFDESCFNDYEKANLKLLVDLEENGTVDAENATSVKELEQRALGGEVTRLPEGSYILDLNQDGSDEVVSLSLEVENYSEYFTLHMNQDSVREAGTCLDNAMYIVSLNQKEIQVLIFEEGPSDDPIITIYNWDGDDLGFVGYLFSDIEDLKVENGRIYCRELSNIFQTVYFDMEYKMDDHLRCIQKEFYPMGNTVIARQDIPTYPEKNADQENGPVLKAGSEVVVVGVDNISWVKLQDVATGEYGWLEMAEDSYTTLIIQGEEVDAYQLFENLRLAG